MQLNTYTTILSCFFIGVMSFFWTSSIVAQNENDIFGLRFDTQMDCTENVLTATLQIQSEGDTFRIGTSSVLFKYDESVLSFLDYQSLNFDENNRCIPGVDIAVWDAQKFNSSVPGIFNLTLLAEVASQSCPIIGADWVDIGKVRFTVNNINASPNLIFDIGNTNFNRHIPDDGTQAPSKGNLTGFNELLAVKCACEDPIVQNDTIKFDCPKTTFDFNLLSNDIVSNPTFSITTNPIKGTAAINPNGILTYSVEERFCGTEEITYKVCNDGESSCCAEGVIFIEFTDDLPPIFINPPSDITVSCDAVPVMETTQALDNCSGIQVLQNETVEDGNCPGYRILIRTWTAVDGCGNEAVHTQKVALEDTEPPVIICGGDITISCSESLGGVLDIPVPELTDNCSDSDKIVMSFTDEVVSDNCVNKISIQLKRTWTATDECGNQGICTQLINVVDEQAPVLICPDDITVDCGNSIDPEVLESFPIAYDSCSTISILYADNEDAPTTCIFDQKTIIRTWKATDACGNETSCEQKITLLGIPCPEPETRVVTVYKCSKEIINFREILDIAPNTVMSLIDKTSQEPIFNTSQYALLSTGCEVKILEFEFEIFDDRGCVIESSILVLKIIPTIYAAPYFDQENCVVKLEMECPDLYLVSWETGDKDGEGNIFEVPQGQVGSGTFYLQYNDLSILENAELSCIRDTFQLDYYCPEACPETIERIESFTVCAETRLNILDKLELSPNLTHVFDNEEVRDSLYSIGNPFACEIGVKEYEIKSYDERQCLIEIIWVKVTVIPAIYYGEVQPTADVACGVHLVLECAENYSVSWEDSNGKSGAGIYYTAEQNTSGTVTFTVEYLSDEIILSTEELACFSQTFTGQFSCIPDCPPGLVEDRILTICGSETIDLAAYFGRKDDYRYEFIGIAVDSFGNYLFENNSCDIITKGIAIKEYDENACFIREVGVAITIYPKIEGIISYEAEGSYCKPKLNVECAENFAINWKDNLGNEGTGNIYEGNAGTSGYVTFYVSFLTDSLNEYPCPRDSFFADFNCPIECPETIERTESFTVCAETRLNILDKLDLSQNLTHVFDNEAIRDSLYSIGNPFACEIGVKEYVIKSYDDRQCLIEIISIKVTVIPAIYAEIQTTSDTACVVRLAMECPNKYSITWKDSNGKTGVGQSYTAEENTSGTVTFTVEYLTDEVFFSEDDLTCFSQTFTGQFNCISDCPQPESETLEIYGCDGDLVNLFERLELADNVEYKIINNETIEDISKIELDNEGTDCIIRQYSLIVEITGENGCVNRVVFVTFNVLPKIKGEIVYSEEGCGLQLDLACPDIYDVVWFTDKGENGEGLTYEPAEGTIGLITFEVVYKDATLSTQFGNNACLATDFTNDFQCCNPAGTVCDDDNPDTFGDQEDGNCGCLGTKCEFENRGKVVDYAELDGCGLVIKMADGTILEPAILPEGYELAVGQEVIFSFIELRGVASVCQAGKIVQIICIENTCPEKGTSCADGDLATINDAYDGNCNCIGETIPEVKSEIDLRMRPNLDCENDSYCVTLQAKAQQEDFKIGTSSIMLSYNQSALDFDSYQSMQFDENSDCIGGNITPWESHAYDGESVAGKFSLSLSLKTEDSSCPEITTEAWENIGTICFDIIDNSQNPLLIFEEDDTHFNAASPNDGTIQINKGNLMGIDTEDALGCTEDTNIATRAIKIKAFLQGAYQPNKKLMKDNLRKKEYIPLREPYTGIPSFVHFGEGGGEETTLEVMQVSDNDAIVDWVFIELRSSTDPTTVETTRSALIQRDGDIVEVDGVSDVKFNVPNGAYYVVVKHRNHLGVMTASPVEFADGVISIIDFTNPETPTHGTNAQLDYRGKMVLWGGNANPDKFVILAGGGLGLPDRDMIFFDIFLSLWYANPNAEITYNSVLHGYYGSDINLDGKIKYQGPQNDIDAIIFFNVLFHPQNTQYRLNFAISEQVP